MTSWMGECSIVDLCNERAARALPRSLRDPDERASVERGFDFVASNVSESHADLSQFAFVLGLLNLFKDLENY